MKRKWLTAGAGLGIGAVMLLASGFSVMANTSGYDAYKSALKNTMAESSLTAKASLTITDNGKKIAADSADMKLNKELNAGSIIATLDNSNQNNIIDIFRKDGKVVIKNNNDDVYRVMGKTGQYWIGGKQKTNPPKAVENVFDTLMGNMREMATVKGESDGSKLAELHLSENQIPAVVNALGTVAVSNAANHNQWDNGKSNNCISIIPSNMPKLADNIKIKEVHLDAKINPKNMLEEQKAEINFTGIDKSGKSHDLVFKLDVELSNFNKTVPDQIDLNGKKTVEVKAENKNYGWHH